MAPPFLHRGGDQPRLLSTMKFELIDQVIEQDAEHIVALKQVSLAEEYLADHFPGFPVLPGVLMVEAMLQAARLLLRARSNERFVLGEVRALKYGNMVRPGDALLVEVELQGESEGGFRFKGVGRVRTSSDRGQKDESTDPGETAVSGRFTMRPVRRNNGV